MSWIMLIYIDQANNNFKFYALERAGHRFTGKINYGRIGNSGTIMIRDEDYAVDKFDEKRREGYTIYNNNYPDMVLSETDIDRLTPESMQERRTTPPPPRTHQRPREINHRVRVTNIQVEKYKTDSDGYLVSYRDGYDRPYVKNYHQYGKFSIIDNPTLYKKFKTFYNNIPEKSVFMKLPYTKDGLEDPEDGKYVFAKHKIGKYFFVVDENNSPVASYEINSVNGQSNFLYIKTNQENYRSILKYIFNNIRPFVGRFSNIVFNVRGKKIVETMDSLFPNTKKKITGGYQYKISLTLISRETEDAITVKRWVD